MRRVVVTGLGIVSCVGNDLAGIAQALRDGRSGIKPVPAWTELGFASRVAGFPDVSAEAPVDRRIRRFMGDAALYAYCAARSALADAGIDATSDPVLRSPRTGLVVGSGVGSLLEHEATVQSMRDKGPDRLLPYSVPRVMGSTASACLSTAFGIRGTSYSLSSACATSAHCIGHAAELIQFGKQDLVIAGGAEEVGWTSAMHFGAMGALSTAFNDASASRPYDRRRDGFVIAGGAGILVLEELEHARKRGARVYAELAGYGASSDGMDMVAPDADGAARAMRLALAESSGDIDYLNTHAASTPLGDLSELNAVREVFGTAVPAISSTKGITGHPIGAAGAHEAIYSLLMLERGFLAGCAHIEALDPACAGLPILMRSEERRVNAVMSNSFGFGGTNASLVFRRI